MYLLGWIRYTPSWITLAHELGHTYSIQNKIKLPAGKWNPDISWDEINASHWENKIRAENGLPLRTHYGVGRDQRGNNIPDPNTPLLQFNSTKSKFFDKDGKVNYKGIKLNSTPYDYFR